VQGVPAGAQVALQSHSPAALLYVADAAQQSAPSEPLGEAKPLGTQQVPAGPQLVPAQQPPPGHDIPEQAGALLLVEHASASTATAIMFVARRMLGLVARLEVDRTTPYVTSEVHAL
jgi:hypothetical protein